MGGEVPLLSALYKNPQRGYSLEALLRCRYISEIQMHSRKDSDFLDNTETWKDVPGYEGRYQVSDMGRVKSLERKVRSRNWYTGDDFFWTVPERILKPGPCNSGHLYVVLGHGEAGKPVHQLVMKAFVGDPPDGSEVRHLNGDPTDNRLVNLRYGTRTENILDVYYQGGRWRKLSVDDVIYIRFSLFCGFAGRSIAKELGVSESTISSIKRGDTFQWVE